MNLHSCCCSSSRKFGLLEILVLSPRLYWLGYFFSLFLILHYFPADDFSMVFLLFCCTVVAPTLPWTYRNRHNTQFTPVLQTSRRYNFTGDSLYILHLYYTFNSVPGIQNSLTSRKQQCCFCCFSASISLFLSYISFPFTNLSAS